MKMLSGFAKYQQRWIFCLSIIYSLSAFDRARATELTPIEQFSRCYGLMTESYLDLTVPSVKALYDAVMAQQMSAADACIALLDIADLTVTPELSPANRLGARVLNTMHSLHASWFEIKTFPIVLTTMAHSGEVAIFDEEQPALYYTAALFKSDVEYRSVMTRDDNLMARRTDMAPLKSGVVLPATQAFTPSYFAPRGDLLGVETNNNFQMNYNYVIPNRIPKTETGSISHSAHYGAGFLGSQPYLLLTVEEEAKFQGDGAIQVPRRWARSVFQDLLCRAMPVIRPSDALSFIEPASAVPFRTSAGCVQCHASMDRMASAIRGFTYQQVSLDRADRPHGGVFAIMAPVTKAEDATWPAAADPDYFSRPPTGRLFFRSFSGELVDISFLGLKDLGEKLSKTQDPYNCIAKRYFQYFTGVDVDVGDVGDPSRGQAISLGDTWYRDQVLKLGSDLQTHQSSKKLIKAILESPAYRGKAVGSL